MLAQARRGHPVLHGRVHAVGDEDRAAGRDGTHARGEVHDRADRRVLGAPLEADLAARGVADGDADAEREVVAAPAPLLRQGRGALAHRDRQPHGIPRRLVERHRIVEEHQHPVAGELGDGVPPCVKIIGPTAW
ncbi:MAG: hypothetical protein U0802_25655 [Candidatus Binatia bacterium]